MMRVGVEEGGTRGTKRTVEVTRHTAISLVTEHKPKWRKVVVPESVQWSDQAEANRLRLGNDPLLGRSFSCSASVGLFPNGRPFLKLQDPAMEALHVTPFSHMPDPSLPFHVTLPDGAQHVVNFLLREDGYNVTVQFRKWRGPKWWWRKASRDWVWADYSTTYRIDGGSLQEVLRKVEAAGYRPPLAEWHVSM